MDFISVGVVRVVVAPALAALTEVEDDVVAAPLEVFVAKGFVAALAFGIQSTNTHADAIAAPLIEGASVCAMGLIGKEE